MEKDIYNTIDLEIGKSILKILNYNQVVRYRCYILLKPNQFNSHLLIIP